MTDREATCRHEAGHIIGAYLHGHGITKAQLGSSRAHPNDAATTVIDFRGNVELYDALVLTLMGPAAEGEPLDDWPPRVDPENSDSMAIAKLINTLALNGAKYRAACAIALHHLADPLIDECIDLVAGALDEHEVLTDEDVRTALGAGRCKFLENGYAKAAA